MPRKTTKGEPISLPYLNSTVAEFEAAFTHMFFIKSRSSPLFKDIRSHIIHEGRNSRIIRASGDADEVRTKKMSAEASLSKEQMNRLSEEDIFGVLNKMCEQAEKQHSETLFSVLHEATEKTGNVVDGKGKPLSHDVLFEVLDKLEQDFPDGLQSRNLSMVIHPSMMERVQKLEAEFKASPELQQKHKQMLLKKYEQYRDREVDRTLAG